MSEAKQSKFNGYPLTRWEADRTVILQEEISFWDYSMKEWTAPVGTQLNGATIPRPVWSIVGPPYVGKYRRASVLHDYFVGEGDNPDVSFAEMRKADRMFFQACRTDGCSWRFAALLYIGVSVGSWSSRIGLSHSETDAEFNSLSLEADAMLYDKYQSIETQAEQIINGPEDFEALERLVDRAIAAD